MRYSKLTTWIKESPAGAMDWLYQLKKSKWINPSAVRFVLNNIGTGIDESNFKMMKKGDEFVLESSVTKSREIANGKIIWLKPVRQSKNLVAIVHTHPKDNYSVPSLMDILTYLGTEYVIPLFVVTEKFVYQFNCKVRHEYLIENYFKQMPRLLQMDNDFFKGVQAKSEEEILKDELDVKIGGQRIGDTLSVKVYKR